MEEALRLSLNDTKATITFEYLIIGWKKFVEGVATGYEYDYDDYKNDLSKRSLIQAIIDHSEPETVTRILRIVSEIDERFKEATLPIAKSFWNLPPDSDYWWTSRKPKIH
jgi:hypothetical protein